MAASASSVRSPSVRTNSSIDHPRHSSHSATQPFSLPQGACNFRQLNVGHSCGCRRFCSSDASHSQGDQNAESLGPSTGKAWCYCGHHACFHEWDLDSGTPRVLGVEDTRQGSPSRSAGQLPRDPMRQQSALVAEPEPSPWFPAGLGTFSSSSQYRQRPSVDMPRPILPYPNSENLPSIRSSFKLPSDLSTRSSARHRASDRRMSDMDPTNSRIGPLFPHSLPLVTHHVDEAAQSATEIATPSSNSIAESQLLDRADTAFQAVTNQLGRLDEVLSNLDNGPIRFGVNNAVSLQDESTATRQTIQELVSHIASLKSILLNIPNFRTSFTGLSQRLDALENMSMCHGSLEECQDRHEDFDGRLLDVEGKVEELEKVFEGIVSKYSTRLTSDDGIDEDRSGSHTNHSTTPRDSDASETGSVCQSELLARLETIDRRLSRFEASALPSDTNPWNIEIVLLPWGRQLRGLWWYSAADFSQSSGIHFDSQDLPSWRDQSEKDWMFPRACGPTAGTFGRIYDRLRSRGFVGNLSIKSNSAYHIEFWIMWLFGELLQTLSRGEGSALEHRQEDGKPLGLKRAFIPLRKIHKSSQLRFLDAAELTTPSLWTADFLNSSVMMKAPMAGHRRLFVTTPSAYLQMDRVDGLNWQSLRELPRKQAGDSQTSQKDFVDEGDAMESCWNFDERLDSPITTKCSDSSSATSKSISGSSFASPPPSPQEISAHESLESQSENREFDLAGQEQMHILSSTPVERIAPITPVSQYLVPAAQINVAQCRASIPVNSTEVPSSSASSSKRQISATEQTASSSIPTQPWKRRRLSKSPTGDGIRDHNWAFTPRLSREPPSPGWLQQYQRPSIHSRHGFENEIDPVLFENVRMRGVTPSAYATPYSNTLVEQVGGDTDVDIDSESEVVEDVDLASEGAQETGEDDEAWEGLIEEDEDDEQ